MEQLLTAGKWIHSPADDLPQLCACDFSLCSGTDAQLKCSACRCVYYCSATCQKKDWKAHKLQCKALKAGTGLVQSDISEVDKKIQEYEKWKNEECSICYETIAENALQLNCGHAFCATCLSVGNFRLHFPCPLCKRETSLIEVYFRMVSNIELFSLKARSYAHGSEMSLHYAKTAARREHTKAVKCLGTNFASESNYASLAVMDAEILYLEGQ